jgi:hypothetical protein
MDPNNGRVYQKPTGMSDKDWGKFCEERGLVSVDAKDVPAVRAMNRHQRRAFAAKQRRA